MGGLVIETVRPGVQFIPDAAAAFRRADAQVRAEFGRSIDVNSTYRSWADQMVMFINWGRYVAGTGPYPGHSKAVHPSESFHVAGIALDSDDWRIPRIVAILAENGFIRNRLHVPNENHHFEWLRNRDQNYGKPIGGAAASAPTVSEEDDMTVMIKANSNIYVFSHGQIKLSDSTDEIRDGLAIGIRQVDLAGTGAQVNAQLVRRMNYFGIPQSVVCTDGVTRSMLNAHGHVLNPETNAYEKNGMWSWERLNRALNTQIKAQLDHLDQKAGS